MTGSGLTPALDPSGLISHGISGHRIALRSSEKVIPSSFVYIFISHNRAVMYAMLRGRASSHTQRINSRRAAIAIERSIMAILFGPMLRSVFFEAIDFAITHTRAEEEAAFDSRPINYLCNDMQPYWPASGEHNYLTALVRRLDHALLTYYRKPHAPAYLAALESPYRFA